MKCKTCGQKLAGNWKELVEDINHPECNFCESLKGKTRSIANNEINKRDIQGFKNILKYLDKNQRGVWGIGGCHLVRMFMLKYVGIGEGMEFEIMEDYDFDELYNALNEVVKNE